MSALSFLDVPVWDTGLTLVLVSNGLILIEINPFFQPLFDYHKDGVSGVFDAQGFSLSTGGEGLDTWQEFDYGTGYQYKEIPALQQWLIQQQLQLH